MQKSSSEPDNHSASQENACNIWNLKVHHCVHNSLAMDPVLNYINPVHTLRSYFLYAAFACVSHVVTCIQVSVLKYCIHVSSSLHVLFTKFCPNDKEMYLHSIVTTVKLWVSYNVINTIPFSVESALPLTRSLESGDHAI
jgi:hypothetical protein